jgi:hypothetical protein
MILLILLFYRKNDPTVNNPYLTAFKSFANADELATTPTMSEVDLEQHGDNLDLVSTTVFHLSFRKMYWALVR